MFKHQIVVGVALLAGLLVLAGCDALDLNNSFLDPSELRVADGYANNALLVPIITHLDSGYAEKTPDYSNAEDVRAEDLIYTPSDYVIGPGDLLNITLTDVSGVPGQETLKQTRVTDSGNITIPLLDPVRATGLTEAQLQKAIHDKYNEMGFIRSAEVSVMVVEPRQRTFEITGQTAQPGQYSIYQPNFRLLDALILARLTPSPDYTDMFVERRPPDAAGSTTQPAIETPASIAPPTGTTLPGVLEPAAHPAPATQGSGEIHFSTPTTEPAMPLEGLTPPDDQPKHVYISGVTTLGNVGEQPAAAANTAPAMPLTNSVAPSAEKKFEFHSPLPEDKTRIIRIPLNKLMAGDLRYNVVIHPNDVLIIPPPSTGEIYVGGHVQRTGVYTVTARQITLTDAIIMAGMLDPLAIPQRTEIIRRTDNHQQIFYHVDLAMVFGGKAPDIMLRPYDEVMVGTNAIAPFLAAFRQAFRGTYGFGFVYDSNYAPAQATSP